MDMNTKTLTEQQEKDLRASLPDEAVSPHPTKPYLSSIKAIYVTERFNQVFGIGGWTADAKVIDHNEGAPVVYVTFQAPEYGIVLSQFGGNDNGGVNAKNYDLGDAYKGAFTDALTKIASYMDVGADVFKGLQNGDGKSQPQKRSQPEPEPTQVKKKETKKSKPEPKKQETKDDDSDSSGELSKEERAFIKELDDADIDEKTKKFLKDDVDKEEKPKEALVEWWKERMDEKGADEFRKKHQKLVFTKLELLK